ncbi:MAG: DUF4197 domain-containing protein [Bacteroidales bacterium]|nr:DUF4197 domain-containing protein [Bacteroidales bacterium]
MKKYCFFFIALIAFTSCEDIFSEGELSTNDIVKGLKTALNIGTDSSTAVLSAANGYFKDEAVKILLPKEAQYVQEKIELLSDIQFFSSASAVISNELDQLVEAINHSAEDAAKDAAPIFSDAITNLTIVDGLEILNGIVPDKSLKSDEAFDSLAATTYLKNQTYEALVQAYAPKINTALSKKIAGNASATSIWNDITGRWNGLMETYESSVLAITAVKLLETQTGKSLNLHEVNTDLGEYTTGKALDGLFVKVGEQEKEIRKNPFQWASDIIQKVFGSVYEKVQEL